jgi:hypothetical protein
MSPFLRDLAYFIEHHDRFSVVRVKGSPSLDAFLSFVQLMEAETSSWPHRLGLFDLRRIDTLQPFTEQFAIGEAVVRCLGRLDKLASVVPEGRMTGTSQKVAQRGGVDLRVFTDEPEATAWLLTAEPGTPRQPARASA